MKRKLALISTVQEKGHLPASKQNYIDNSMNAYAIKNLRYKKYLKILSKLLEPLDKCNLK